MAFYAKLNDTMNEFEKILLFTTGAGSCIPLGGLLARIENIHPKWLENELRHFVIALGGGILIAAVALVLVPEGSAHLSASADSVLFLFSGGLCFFGLERFLGRRHLEVPQMSAMLLDYIPESIALGGIFATGAQSAPLLALLIALQNLPEGFNAYREIKAVGGTSPRYILSVMCAFIPLGPLFGVLGFLFLAQRPDILGAIMLFAAGGILYLIFQDIAPQSRLRRHWAPPLGAVLGFCIGMLGDILLNHV